MRGSAKVLVVLIGETRATELTAESFRANVLDALGADLALCVRAPKAAGGGFFFQLVSRPGAPQLRS